MRIRNHIASWLASSGTLAIVGSVIVCDPQTWRMRICEPDVFMTAFTLACAAVLFWPRRDHASKATIIGRAQL